MVRASLRYGYLWTFYLSMKNYLWNGYLIRKSSFSTWMFPWQGWQWGNGNNSTQPVEKAIRMVYNRGVKLISAQGPHWVNLSSRGLEYFFSKKNVVGQKIFFSKKKPASKKFENFLFSKKKASKKILPQHEIISRAACITYYIRSRAACLIY